MIRRPPRSTRTDTLFPYTTLFRSCQFEQRQGVSPCQACLNTAGILHAPCFLQFDLPVIKEGEAASTPRMTCAPVSRGVPAMQGRRLHIQQGLWQLCTKMPRSAKLPRCWVFDLAAGAKALPFGNDRPDARLGGRAG